MNVVLSRKNSVWQRFTSILLVMAMVLSSMTITIADGESGSGNDDLNSLVNGVSIKYPNSDTEVDKDDAGAYQLVAGQPYKLEINYAEVANDTQHQFSTTGVLKYKTPTGFNAAQGDHKFDFDITNEKGEIVTIKDNVFTVEGNIITVKFNKDEYPAEFAELNKMGNAVLKLDIDGTFDGSGTYDFGDGSGTYSVTVDAKDGDITTSKSGYYDKSTNRINYTVTVSGKGTNENVIITDELGSCLTYTPGSFSVTSNDSGRTLNATDIQVNGSSFTYNVGNIANNETITITYSADVAAASLSALAGSGYFGTESEIGNRVNAKSDQDSDSTSTSNSASVYNGIQYTSMSKSYVSAGGEGTERKLTWTVEYNKGTAYNASGRKLTDTLFAPSNCPTDYDGNVTVYVYDQSGSLLRTDSVTPSNGSFEYSIPQESQSCYYVLKYTTVSNVSALNSDVNVGNTITDDKGNSTSSSGPVGPGEGNTSAVAKYVMTYDTNSVSWRIVIDVPKSGLDTAYITDELQGRWVSGTQYYDSIDYDSIQVGGLLSGETYQTTRTDHGFKIDFFKDGVNGLKSGDVPRKITVDVSSSVNQEWLNATAALTGSDATNSYYKQHQNNVTLQANTNSIFNTADVVIEKPSIIKRSLSHSGSDYFESAEPWGYTDDGRPVYCYQVIMKGVVGSVHLDDKFDTNVFEYYQPAESGTIAHYTHTTGVVYGGSQETYHEAYLATAATDRAVITETQTGIAIDIPETAIPKVNGTGYYSFYSVNYYLAVKASVISSLNAVAAANKGKVGYTNEVSNGITSDTANVEYSYDAIKKSLTNSPADENNIAKYEIRVNPGAYALNGGNAYDITDILDETLLTLSLDYTSISIKSEGGEDLIASGKAYWNVKSYKTIFTIPDETSVIITYNCRVIVPPQGGQVTIRNSAFYGKEGETDYGIYSDVCQDISTYKASGSGHAYSDSN